MPNKMLMEIKLFLGINEPQAELISKVVQEVRYEKDDVIFKQGDLNNKLYIVKSGEVSISFHLAANSGNIRPIINKVRSGEFFGEFALIDSLPRTATAVASAESTLLVIGAEDFHAFIHQHTDIGFITMYNFNKILVSRIRQTDQQLQSALLMGWNAYQFEKYF